MNTHKGIAWWENLHSWQKIAVVRNFPFVTNIKLAEILGLGLKSKNRIVGVRTRINDRQRFGKDLPEPCSPEKVGELVIPPEELAASGPKGRQYKKYIQKPQPETIEPVQKTISKPLNFEKPRPCCEAGCEENAVPRLAFCKVHAKERYTMTPQIEALLAAAP